MSDLEETLRGTFTHDPERAFKLATISIAVSLDRILMILQNGYFEVKKHNTDKKVKTN